MAATRLPSLSPGSPSKMKSRRSKASGVGSIGFVLIMCTLAFVSIVGVNLVFSWFGDVRDRDLGHDHLISKTKLSVETLNDEETLWLGDVDHESTNEEEEGDTPYEQTVIKMEDALKRSMDQIKQLKQTLNRRDETIESLKNHLSYYEPDKMTERVLFDHLARASPQVKEEVINLIMTTYASTSSSPDAQYEILDSAFEAIDFKHTDGEPVQVNGYPFLYVGSVGAALNHTALKSHNITHIVNWSSTSRCDVWDDIQYECIIGLRSMIDMGRRIGVKKIADSVEFIEKARLAGGSVMSHCWYGRNRSVTVLVAYLMKYAGMSINEATRLIAENRPQADPYVEALKSYQRHYLD